MTFKNNVTFVYFHGPNFSSPFLGGRFQGPLPRAGFHSQWLRSLTEDFVNCTVLCRQQRVVRPYGGVVALQIGWANVCQVVRCVFWCSGQKQVVVFHRIQVTTSRVHIVYHLYMWKAPLKSILPQGPDMIPFQEHWNHWKCSYSGPSFVVTARVVWCVHPRHKPWDYWTRERSTRRRIGSDWQDPGDAEIQCHTDRGHFPHWWTVGTHRHTHTWVQAIKV